MDTNDAHRLALRLMKEWGLDSWRFEFDRAVKRFGACHYGERKITLSRPLTELNSEEEVAQTIRHELAHALVGPRAGHGTEWQRVAQIIGYTGARTHNAAIPKAHYVGTCPNCGRTSYRFRRTDVACKACCEKYNGGAYLGLYALTWVDTRTKVH